MTLGLSISEAAAPADRGAWAGRIRAAWNRTRDDVIAIGRLLAEAKAGLAHGEFMAMVEADLPFGISTAERFMKIARDPRLTNSAHAPILPASREALYELTKLDDGTFNYGVTKGLIRPDMERKEAERLRTGQRRAERLASSEAKARSNPPPESLTAGGRRYVVGYIDPPWKFETFSENGLQKAAELHYPTMTHEQLMALPVGAFMADDAALFVWTTTAHLWAALQLMGHWGFAYKSHCVWAKTNADGSPHRGHGYWFIGAHEILLAGARGNIPAPQQGAQSLSLVECAVGRHSEKPAAFRDLIDRYFPGVAKIELFARGALPDGWVGWGNEADSGGAAGSAEKETAE